MSPPSDYQSRSLAPPGDEIRHLIRRQPFKKAPFLFIYLAFSFHSKTYNVNAYQVLAAAMQFLTT
jgi:hypothetical protein